MLEILRELVVVLKEIRLLITDLRDMSAEGGVDLKVTFNGTPVSLPPSSTTPQ